MDEQNMMVNVNKKLISILILIFYKSIGKYLLYLTCDVYYVIILKYYESTLELLLLIKFQGISRLI